MQTLDVVNGSLARCSHISGALSQKLRTWLAFIIAGTCVLLLGSALVSAADLTVATDFEGGSARVQSIDQTTRTIRIQPGGDPARGWVCWWYVWVSGMNAGERITLQVEGSDVLTRNNGQLTDKPLAASWAQPNRASFSVDGTTWRHTEPGRREGGCMSYEIVAEGPHLWLAWGPPFTPRDSERLREALAEQGVTVEPLDLAQTREGRPVAALRFRPSGAAKPGVWVQARQHAWESGSSWVARGFAEWLASEAADARWLRANAEVVLVPIMDVDRVTTGDGGKEAAPRDHNRDWDEAPHYPEVAAAQRHLREWAAAGRVAVFLELHNPAPGDLQPFFFMGADELLNPIGLERRTKFLQLARERIAGPLPLQEKPRFTGPKYHPLWRQISNAWVNELDPSAVAVCLETSWNTPASTTEGYRKVGQQLGEAVAAYLRALSKPNNQ